CGQKRAVVVERGGVHVGHDQRNFQHRQRRHVERVGVHNALHIGAGAIDPAVKTVGGVGHSLSVEDVEVLVDQQQVGVGDLVEPQAEPLGVVGAFSLGAGGDL